MSVSQAAPVVAETRGKSDLSAHFDCLAEVSRAVNASLPLATVLNLVLDRAVSVTGAEAGCVMVLDESSGELLARAARGRRAGEVFGTALKLGEGIAGWVALYGQPLLLQDGIKDARFHTICQRDDVRDALCVPLQADGTVEGVLFLRGRLAPGAFSEEDLRLLVALGHQTTLAIRGAALQEQMVRQRRTMERLLSKLVWAQEEERKKVSLEIHDGPAQTLYAALFRLQTYQALLGEDAEKATEELNAAVASIRDTLQETRRLIFDLRPMSLDEIGLVPALRQYAEKLNTRHEIRVEVRTRGAERRFPVSLETALYRIVQEALTNTWKHARATKASVIVSFDARRCDIQIADDGVGFDLAAVGANGQGEHLGIASIRERAEMIGGSLRIASAPGAGTTVIVSVPVNPAEGKGDETDDSPANRR